MALCCFFKKMKTLLCTTNLSLHLQWWQVEKVNPIKLYEENKVMAGFSLLSLLFKQGGCSRVKGAVNKLLSLYSEKKIRPLVDSLWAPEEVSRRC